MSQSIEGNNNTQINIGEVKNQLSNTSSIIATALPRIADLVNTSEVDQNDTIPFEIEQKISHNNVTAFKEILDEYVLFGPKVDEIYNEFENDNPGFKNSISRYFKNKYQLVRNNLVTNAGGLSVLDVVKNNSDRILSDIIKELKADLQSANNLSLKIEEIDTCAVTVVCHAFTMCKILEKPSDN